MLPKIANPFPGLRPFQMEESHLFFGRATSGFSALFAPHPPIEERIRRIDPSWDGDFPEGVSMTDAGVAPRAAVPGAAAFAGGIVGAAPPAATDRIAIA